MGIVIGLSFVVLQVVALLVAVRYFLVHKKTVMSLLGLFIFFLSITVCIRTLDIILLFLGSSGFDLVEKYLQFFILLSFVRSTAGFIAFILGCIIVLKFIWNKIKK